MKDNQLAERTMNAGQAFEQQQANRHNTIAQMAGTIYAADWSACVVAWSNRSDRDQLTQKECVKIAAELYQQTEDLLWPAFAADGSSEAK